MNIHLLAVPHTLTRADFSGCAFTGKVHRFSPMMRAQGFRVVHYGCEGSQSGASEDVWVMSQAEQEALLGHPHRPLDKAYPGDDSGNQQLYSEFNRRLRVHLQARVSPEDVIALPYRRAHCAAIDGLPGFHVETGIGYTNPFAPYRIYESQAWLHWNRGRMPETIEGSDYEWVAPNYYQPSDWQLGTGAGGYVLYFGRLVRDKGLDVVLECARFRPDLTFVLCGYGDPTPWLILPNVVARQPVVGDARNALLGDAMAVMMPTRYIEPFGGVTVEANLCGTPVLGSAFGSFTETIEHGVTGYRCRTLGDWLAALELAPALSRQRIRAHAAGKYSLEAIGPVYRDLFHQLRDLGGRGWYSLRSSLGAVTQAAVDAPPLDYTPAPPCGLFGHDKLPRKTIALTFDDGPHPEVTASILDTLADEEVPASFFVMGENARRFPWLVQRAAREGHEVCNHSDVHLRYPDLDDAEIEAELSRCEDALTAAGAHAIKPRPARPPYGACDARVAKVIASKGHPLVMWTVTTDDWRPEATEASVVSALSAVLEAGDGAIVLLHDVQHVTASALSQLIGRAKAQGYRFVLVSELLEGKYAPASETSKTSSAQHRPQRASMSMP